MRRNTLCGDRRIISDVADSTVAGRKALRPVTKTHSWRGAATLKQWPIRLLALLIITPMAVPLSPAQARAIGEQVQQVAGPAVYSLFSSRRRGQDFEPQQEDEVPSLRATRVTHFRLCPRKLKLYVKETSTLVPLPLDHNKEVVHGIALTWETSDPGVAEVSESGEVTAVAPGQAVITVSVGTARANVSVQVREGQRPKLTDLQWDLEHADDCLDPEQASLNESEPGQTEATLAALSGGQLSPFAPDTDARQMRPTPETLKQSARPAVLRRSASAENATAEAANLAAAAAQKKFFGRGLYLLPPDGESEDPPSSSAAASKNATGNPRFAPMEESPGGSTKTRKNLGNHNYIFTAPILGLGGRGIGIDLPLTYNSRVWTKEDSSSTMIFNYGKGWPAAGWSLGYGRIIPNYNGSGEYLLIEPDGTRTSLVIFLDADGIVKYRSTDGRFIRYDPRPGYNDLQYPDGTTIRYAQTNGRLLPAVITNRNGNKLTIGYRRTAAFRAARWAIESVYDTLGRNIRFRYYGEDGYPESDAQGKPRFALAAITAPAFGGTGERKLVQFTYMETPIRHDFGSLRVDGPASGSQLTVLKRIYYPNTGRGFIFSDHSSYGMARKVSSQIGMTDTSDGTTIAYTRYNYTTKSASGQPPDPDEQQGSLNDAPQYTQQQEWWQGIPGGAAAVYRHARSSDTANPRTVTVTYPNNLEVVTSYDNTSGSAIEGKVVSTVYQDPDNRAVPLRRINYTYTTTGGGIQVQKVEVRDEAGNVSKTEYEYGDYGRVREIFEYNSGGAVERKRRFRYLDTTAYYNTGYMLHLVTQEEVLQGTTVKAKTVYTYDDYAFRGGMTTYPGAPEPPNHGRSYTTSYTVRGNVTRVQAWTDIAADTYIDRGFKYDKYGNVTQADVSCCSTKAYTFSDSTTHYSQPDSVRDGQGTSSLTTSLQYDLNTGLVKTVTDPDSLRTRLEYDSAWRQKKVTSAAGAISTTEFKKDGNNKDTLVYVEQVSYTDRAINPKVITTRSQLDGAGRVIRAGTGQGESPSNFDAVAIDYDSMGRVSRRSNPYLGDASLNGNAQYWTVSSYDLLSRVFEVQLPDHQPSQPSKIQTTYSGATMTVTDQVGRKRKSEVDALGRLIKVIEQNPANGSLDPGGWVTTYTYDLLDNLTEVNQGGQTRTFQYDALSRLTRQTTPEGGATTFTYTSFNAVRTRTDARGVVTTYGYDGLNRLETITYNSVSGVAATAPLTITYKATSPGRGQVGRIEYGAGVPGFSYDEQFTYDDLGRARTNKRTIDGNIYETSYEYNQAGQLAVIVYPSGKRMRAVYDDRGRLYNVERVERVAGSDRLVTRYVSSVNYSVAGQVTGLGLGNGVAETYEYSPQRLQLTRQLARRGTSTLMDLSYSYQASAGASGAATTAGNSGQLISVTGTVLTTSGSQNRNQAFTYDNVGRLMTATAAGARNNRRYEYDQWGNRTRVWEENVPLPGGGIGNCVKQNLIVQRTGTGVPTTNRAARVEEISGCDALVTLLHMYDAAGNVTDDGHKTYQYDAESRLVKLNPGQAGEASYYYDSSNRRVKKVSGGHTTYYLWEGSQVIAEYSTAPGGGEGLRYYLADRLSTRVTMNKEGIVIGSQDHLAFGEDAGTSSGQVEKHRFTTYERDSESGTDYAINRQYATSNGRFMRPDPIAGSIANPQGLNRYAYTSNDPINRVDPLGLLWIEVIWDGVTVDRRAAAIAWRLWEHGAADIVPFGAVRNRRGDAWVIDPGGDLPVISVSDLNDFWRLLPVSLQQESHIYYISTDPYFSEITKIAAAAIKRLVDRPECRKYLSGFLTDAAKKLEKMWQDRDIKSGDAGGDYGEYNHRTRTITLDTKLIFQDPTVGGDTTKFGLSRFEAQQLTLLHELTHATYLFGNLHITKGHSERLDQNILNKCFR